MNTTQRVYGYTRVSTTEQAKEGVSLEAQKDKIAAQCMVKDWNLIEVLCDEGLSARDISHRPQLQKLIELIESRQLDVIIVYKLDRLTRSVKDLGYLIELFDKYDVNIVSLNESIDTTTATGRLMLNLLASVSQWEREVIGERTKDALRHMKATKKVYSPVPYGFDRNDDLLIENNNETRAIKEIQRLHNKGFSLREIASELEAMGIKPKKSNIWHANTIRQILNRAA